MKLIYGIPLWLMKSYLADLGATELDEQTMAGENWQAVVQKSDPVQIGPSIRVGRIAVEFSGDSEAIAAVVEQLHWKTLRGGG